MTFRFPDGTTGLGVVNDVPKVDDSLKLNGKKWRVVRVDQNPSGYDVWCESHARLRLRAASTDRDATTRSLGDLRADLMREVEKVRRWQKLRRLKREGLWR